MSLVLRSKKRRLVMIEPPGQFFGSGIFEINDRIFIAIKHSQVKKIPRSMKQTGVINIRFRMNAFLIKTREGGRRSDAIEAMTMIKQTKFHVRFPKERAILATEHDSRKGSDLPATAITCEVPEVE